MFDHYIHYQGGDPRRRLRLQIAASAAGITTFSFILFGALTLPLTSKTWPSSPSNTSR